MSPVHMDAVLPVHNYELPWNAGQ